MLETKKGKGDEKSSGNVQCPGGLEIMGEKGGLQKVQLKKGSDFMEN